jgi:hypothetical protein
MKTKALARAVCAFSCLAFGCIGQISQDDSPNDETQQTATAGLTLKRHDASALEGTFVTNDGEIQFSAKTLGRDQAELQFQINDKVLHYEALASTEEQAGFFRVNADVAFTAAERGLASNLLDALVAEFGNEASALSLFEASVPKMAHFIANQPEGVLVTSIVRAELAGVGALRDKSLRDDGVTCIKRGRAMSVQYDDKRGTVSTVSVNVGDNWGSSACRSGDYNCMGRCSAGCGGFGGGWTLDCLEHDACSHNLCAAGGSRDANCGDEYSNAAWDVFASCAG